MKNQIKLLIFFAPFISMAFLMPISALAASPSNSVTVLPAKTDISASQGDKIRKTLMLVNSSNNPVSLKVSIKDFKASGETGKIEFYLDSSPQSAANWLVPQYEVISIAGLSSAKMDYIIKIDKDMPGKGYDGAIIFQLYDTAKKTASGNSFGSLIALNVMANGITSGGELSNFSAPMFQYANPIKLGLKINNKGNSNISLSGNAQLLDMFGKKITEFKLDKLDVYPNSSRIFNFALSNNSLFGIYKANIQISNPAKNGSQMASSAWFLFLPWQKLLLGFLILAGIIITATVVVKILNKIKIRKGEWAA